MNSFKRISASQINGKMSRGPKTAAGKMKARQNSWRHGLTALHSAHPVYGVEIAAIAKALCNGDDHPLLAQQAAIIAECEVLLRCIRLEQTALVEWFRDPAAVPLRRRFATRALAKARAEESKVAFDEYMRLEARLSNPDLASKGCDLIVQSKQARRSTKVWQPPRERDEYEAMCAALPDLRRLSRYEKRAWSRRTRAVRRFKATRDYLRAIAPRTNEGRSLSLGVY